MRGYFYLFLINVIFLLVELLRLSGFPSNFSFPEGMPLKKQFACIGNSINVTVVTEILKLTF